MEINETLAAVLSGFKLDTEPVICEPYGCGHINRTFLVVTAYGKRYILQRINDKTFPNVAALMDNISRVTAHIRAKNPDPRCTVQLVPTISDELFLKKNGYWRVYEFTESSVCMQSVKSNADFYQSAVGFGNFQRQLEDFPAETLFEVIPHFHDTPDRYRLFKEALEKDAFDRRKLVEPEIGFFLEREKDAGTLQNMRDAGELPTRVTHNDTKLNNVLLDEKTRKALCVIDLDTVMPGLSLYDYGDAIRYGAATAAEDERNLDSVGVSLNHLRIFTRGYLSVCSLGDAEIEMLPQGAKTMTLECGMRFLTDYLSGDTYFATSREGQNLDRARTQIKLVRDMEEKWDKIHKIVREERI